MLSDPRAEALGPRFAGQWLRLQDLEKIHPDALRYPYFDQTLADAMARETELLFSHIVEEDRPVMDLLTADYTFVNERLARHYGVPGILGQDFRKISYPDDTRRGLLGHGSILTMTSHADRTSPVLRGKWLLENILGSPPPPPPSVETLDENGSKTFKTLRERLENHRNQGTCATCHQKMDALGFGLENFDAIGAWRTQDGGSPIDSSGELPGGRFFQGPQQLKSILLKTERNAFVRCLTEKMLTFALGRGLEIYDKPVINQICKKLEEKNYKFSELVLAIVQSLPFQRRAISGEKS